MTAIQTLNKVVELAVRRRDEALSKLTQLQRELQQAQDQMNQLQTYAQEAQQRWTVRGSAGVDVHALQHHQQFMQKIRHAMDFQQGVLQQREALIAQAQQHLQVTERDVAGLRKYTDRQVQTLLQRAQRQEQKATDEMALVIHARLGRAAASAATPRTRHRTANPHGGHRS